MRMKMGIHDKTGSRLLYRSGHSAGLLTAILFVSLISLSSCLQVMDVEYSRFENIPEEGIPPHRIYDFSPVPADSASLDSIPYDLILVVRYSNKMDVSRITFDIEQYSLCHAAPDTTNIEIPLFDTHGQSIGKGNFFLYEKTDTIFKGIKIHPGYTLSVSTPLSRDDTRGIRAIGIILARHGGRNVYKNIFNIWN